MRHPNSGSKALFPPSFSAVFPSVFAPASLLVPEVSTDFARAGERRSLGPQGKIGGSERSSIIEDDLASGTVDGRVGYA